MTLSLSKSDTAIAEQLANVAGVPVPDLIGGLLRWTAILHSIAPPDDEEPGYAHPADRPADEKPVLSPALEALRVNCNLYISAVDIGTRPDGPLWMWKVWNSSQEELPAAIEHDARSLDKSLLDFLTGYALGMKAIPF
jgi:hypothetical protein